MFPIPNYIKESEIFSNLTDGQVKKGRKIACIQSTHFQKRIFLIISGILMSFKPKYSSPSL